MKKILQCLGTLVASVLCSYLLWLLFYWLTPYVMGVGWLLFLLYVFFAGGLLTSLVGSISTLLAVPMSFFTAGNKAAKVINALPFLFHGYCAVCLPWGLDMEYGFLQYLIAISLSATYLIAFGSIVVCPFTIEENDN